MNGYFLEPGVTAVHHAYFPFGEELTPIAQDSEQMKFTGHERDLGVSTTAADDLDYMHARSHNPQTGRFLSVDPVHGSLGAPQSWNRYIYGANNPIKYTDPTGMSVRFTADKGEEVRSFIADILRDANASAEVLALVESESVDLANGTQQLAAWPTELKNSSNFVVSALATLINDSTNVLSINVSSKLVGGGGAEAKSINRNHVEVTINRQQVAGLKVNVHSWQLPIGSPTTKGDMTPGLALFHEMGHAAGHFEGTFIPKNSYSTLPGDNKNNAYALWYENRMRHLMRDPYNVFRANHQ